MGKFFCFYWKEKVKYFSNFTNKEKQKFNILYFYLLRICILINVLK